MSDAYNRESEPAQGGFQSHNRTPVDDSETIVATPSNGADEKKDSVEFAVVSKRVSSGVYQLTGGDRTVTLSLGRNLLWHWVDDSNSTQVGEPTRLKRDAKAQAVQYLVDLHNTDHGTSDEAVVEDDNE